MTNMNNMNERKEKYLSEFALMIQKETVSSWHEADEDIPKFIDFHETLKELFPNLFSVAEYENFSGSMLLRWKGKDSSKDPVLFMGHMDVVAAPGEWLHEPFSAHIDEERIWGRGTLDNKGGLFAVLKAADELALEGFTPSRDIFFESSRNEETTGEGANLISLTLKERGIMFDAVFDEGGMILREPVTGAKGMFAMVGMGEKGCCELKFTALSDGGHASTPPKNSPLVRLGKFMAEIEKKDPFRREINPVMKEMLRRLSSYMGKLGIITGHLGLFGKLLTFVLPSISPSAGAMLKTTLAFTMAEGSQGVNVLPHALYARQNSI